MYSTSQLHNEMGFEEPGGDDFIHQRVTLMVVWDGSNRQKGMVAIVLCSCRIVLRPLGLGKLKLHLKEKTQ